MKNSVLYSGVRLIIYILFFMAIVLCTKITSFAMPVHQEVNDEKMVAKGEQNGIFLFDKEKQTIEKYLPKSDFDEDIIIPEKIDGVRVYHIKEKAFEGADINNIIIPKTIKSIGENAFNKAIINKLTLEISRDIMLGNGIFSGATINIVEISKNVETLGKDMFINANIKSLTINSLPKILGYPFLNSEVQEIILSENIKNIEKNIFGKIKKIENIEVPKSVGKISKDAFFETVIGKIKFEKDTFIEDGAFSFSVIEHLILPSDAKEIQGFGNSKITKIILPSALENIKEGAFENAYINKIILPDSLKIIEKNAFLKAKIDEIIMPSVEIMIKENAFGKANIKKIVFNSYLKIIEPIFDKTKIQKAYFSNNMESVPDLIFAQNTKNAVSIGNIILEENIKKIGEKAFENAVINSINIPSSVVEIGDGAFKYAKIYTDINIPSNLKKINKETFYNMSIFGKITIQEGISEIGESAFEGVYFAKKDAVIILPESIKIIANNGFKGANISKIDIKDGLVTIGDSAFMNTNIKDIFLPNSLQSIGDQVFYNTNIIAIKIPYMLEKMIPKATNENTLTKGSLFGMRLLKELVIDQEKNNKNDAKINGYWGCDTNPKVFYKDEYISINHNVQSLNNSEKQSKLTISVALKNTYTNGKLKIIIPKISESIFMDTTGEMWEKTYVVLPDVYVCSVYSPTGIRFDSIISVPNYTVSSVSKNKKKKGNVKKYKDYINRLVSTDAGTSEELYEDKYLEDWEKNENINEYNSNVYDETYNSNDDLFEDVEDDIAYDDEYDIEMGKNILSKQFYPDLDGGKIEEDIVLDSDNKVNINLVSPKKDGFIFDGWIDKYGERALEPVFAEQFKELVPRYIVENGIKKMENYLWISFILGITVVMWITKIEKKSIWLK